MFGQSFCKEEVYQENLSWCGVVTGARILDDCRQPLIGYEVGCKLFTLAYMIDHLY